MACLFLLVAAPSVSIAAGIPAKAFRCGAQKAGGQAADLADAQDRMLAAGEAAPPGRAGILEPSVRLPGLLAKAGIVPFAACLCEIEARRPRVAGARAPPPWDAA